MTIMRAMGMMSGTSLDGVDAAVIDTDGVRIVGFGPRGFRRFSEVEAEALHAARGIWPDDPGAGRATAMARDVTEAAHLAVARDLLAQGGVGVIGFHGQTLAHDPRGRGTHQAGRGWWLARALGRPVVWDFRTEDVRRGGEGAPLAPFFHWACARWAVEQGAIPPRPVAFLNLGGVGNLTWVDPTVSAPEQKGACLAFDTGPANAPMNDLMRARRGVAQDENGALALSGRADEAVIARFLTHPYFARQALSQSLDRDAFSELAPAVAHLGDGDAMATLAGCAAAAVAAGLSRLPRVGQVLVGGGGRHNRALMAALKSRTRAQVAAVEQIGLDGDMLEAQAFGWLAVRVLRGLPTSGPDTTGAPAPVCGGRISYPVK